MRHGRAKQARKTLQFFARITHHKIRPPYSILLDGTFLVAVMQYKLHDEMTSRLHRLLQQHEHHDHGGEASSMIHLLTTRSTLIELQKLEQAVATKGGAEKALVFQQARAWAEANCMRILEKDDVPDESSSIDVSSIPTTPSSVIQKQQQHGNNNKKRARGGGGGGIGDVSLVGREFLRLAMAVLVQEEDDEDEKANEKSVTAATASSTKEAGEESASTKEHGEGSGSSREQGQKRRDGKRQIPKHQNHHHHQKHQHCYYFVASQDEQVLDRLRHLGHVPIIRLARGSVLLLEQPSKAATQQAWREERLKWRLGIGGAGTATAAGGTSNKGGAATVAASSATSSMLQQERNEAQRLVKEERQERRREQQQQQPYAARHKKRAKGPNPLSCKPGAKKKQKT